MQATLRALGDRRLREIVERFADSFEHGEVDAILAMLTEDATFSMPPIQNGADAAMTSRSRG